MIRPAIIANTQQEFDERYQKTKFADIIHLDLMDGKFVENTSLLFDVRLPDHKFHWHLMSANPYTEIERLPGNTFYVHAEIVDIEEHIKFCFENHLPVCFAVNPETNMNMLEPFYEDIDKILVMTVHPGKYGAPLIPNAVDKIQGIPQKIEVCVDGAMTPNTVHYAALADCIVSGSFIQKNGEDGFNELSKQYAAVRIPRT